jgi:hypothetical protein
VSAEDNGGLVEGEQTKRDREQDKLIIGQAIAKGGPPSTVSKET